MKFLYSKKMKNIVCLVGLILLGFFVLKHFNLIEGMVEGVEGGGGGGGGGGPGGGGGGGPGGGGDGSDSDGKKKPGGNNGKNAGGDGNYTVNINVEAPKMNKINPGEYGSAEKIE